MAVIDVKIATSTDDAYMNVGTTNIYLTTNYVCLGYDGTYDDCAGFRFAGITVPSGATITSAYITLTMENNMGTFAIYQRIAAEQSNDASTFSTAANLYGRTLTTAYVDWSPNTSWPLDSTHNTSDLSTIISELVSDYSGLSSANIVFIFKKNSGTIQPQFWSYDGSTTKCANLHIEYTGFYTRTLPPSGTVGMGLRYKYPVLYKNGIQIPNPSGSSSAKDGLFAARSRRTAFKRNSYLRQMD